MYEERLRALLEGLECEHIAEFMKNATVENCREFGAAYLSAITNKSKTN